MKIGEYEVLEHTETVKPERFVVFRGGKRAFWLGKRGGFLTWDAAVDAAKAADGKQIAFMDEVWLAMEAR
jgi:hypothetical protein